MWVITIVLVQRRVNLCWLLCIFGWIKVCYIIPSFVVQLEYNSYSVHAYDSEGVESHYSEKIFHKQWWLLLHQTVLFLGLEFQKPETKDEILAYNPVSLQSFSKQIEGTADFGLLTPFKLFRPSDWRGCNIRFGDQIHKPKSQNKESLFIWSFLLV